ncbi:hypothetical protein [Microbacterium sp. PRC9]|uniref:hypothetical protein n=1 Tax=Microbacterium sp. PRC9 TaxID=2962591 RepID=UPI002882A5FD|nr:hypothetical protein [Microbacterium sp. PRC9]MDT0142799.1 hypothetical protein [Microbacterium sp. PRC9]
MDTTLFEDDPDGHLSRSSGAIYVSTSGRAQVTASISFENSISIGLSPYAQIMYYDASAGTTTGLVYAYGYIATSGKRDTVTLQAFQSVDAGDCFYVTTGEHSGTSGVLPTTGGGGWSATMTVQFYAG